MRTLLLAGAGSGVHTVLGEVPGRGVLHVDVRGISGSNALLLNSVTPARISSSSRLKRAAISTPNA